MPKPIISIIIPARSEFPQICFTVYSIIHALETDGFKPSDFEIIIVNNCSDDEKPPERRALGGTIDYLRTMGIYSNRVLKTINYPLAGNHTCRNRGVEIARGEYIFISDAHMCYQPGFFKEFIRAVDESGGMVHAVLDWIGAYPPQKGGLGYTIKLGDDIRGTWNNYHLFDKDKKQVWDWWYVPSLGHCSLGCKRKQFMDFKGYQEYHRCYGGGEFFVDMKWWMLGSCVVVNPKMVSYHFRAGRGYSYNNDDYKYNIFQIGYALGADEWVDRAYINWLMKGRKEILDKKKGEAWVNAQQDREWLKKNGKYTFNELLVQRPWEKKNDEKYGNHIRTLQIFHTSWLKQLENAPQYCKDYYNNSELQKKLDIFIRENLWDFVYKKDEK